MYLKADTKIFFFLNWLGEALEGLLAAAKERFFAPRGPGSTLAWAFWSQSSGSNMRASFFSETREPSLVSARTSLLVACLFSALVNMQGSESVMGRTESLTLVDRIHLEAPLTHLIRNAIDRGIESPQEKGIVLVAGTNDRLSLRSDFTLHYTKEPIDYPYRPSVNVFFKSLSQYWKHKATAVLYQLR